MYFYLSHQLFQQRKNLLMMTANHRSALCGISHIQCSLHTPFMYYQIDYAVLPPIIKLIVPSFPYYQIDCAVPLPFMAFICAIGTFLIFFCIFLLKFTQYFHKLHIFGQAKVSVCVAIPNQTFLSKKIIYCFFWNQYRGMNENVCSFSDRKPNILSFPLPPPTPGSIIYLRGEGGGGRDGRGAGRGHSHHTQLSSPAVGFGEIAGGE